ncbi:cupin domain-containing protein [archaeon]|nr:MAG: cupin domain-containing protein [archaeon]
MKFSRSDAKYFEKHGAKMWFYFGKDQFPNTGLLFIKVDSGHYEEFWHDKSTFIYYILEGNGSFYLDGKVVKVKATDVVVIPPRTKIYYLGKMKLLLITTPAWEEKYEHHVRDILRNTRSKSN